jgi:hypothetical protein
MVVWEKEKGSEGKNEENYFGGNVKSLLDLFFVMAAFSLSFDLHDLIRLYEYVIFAILDFHDLIPLF